MFNLDFRTLDKTIRYLVPYGIAGFAFGFAFGLGQRAGEFLLGGLCSC